MQVYMTSLFHWMPNERTFVCEMSELSAHAGPVREQFSIFNPKTGGSCAFQLDHIDRDDENEVTAWVYRSTSTDPKHKDLKVTIFND